MPRQVFRWLNGRLVEIGVGPQGSSEAPFIHEDSMDPIRHPVTGEMYDSYSRYMETNSRLGLEVVGNDLLSRKRHDLPEKITDRVILDKIEKAESIMSDPAKYREVQNRNLERLERKRRLIDGA